MQILLTNEEYLALKEKAENSMPTDELHKHCVKVATTVPIFIGVEKLPLYGDAQMLIYCLLVKRRNYGKLRGGIGKVQKN